MVVFCVLSGIKLLVISRKVLHVYKEVMTKFVILTQKEILLINAISTKMSTSK